VFLEGRKSKTYVGRLTRDGDSFRFTYGDRYLYGDKAISLGPDLPLTRKIHAATNLFPAFLDRIPSRGNPAYEEYCARFDISPDETDPFILLPTIARKGPSSFIFEPVFGSPFGREQLKEFRTALDLTLREFSAAFDVSPATIHSIESGKATGRDVLKRLEIYFVFPEVARFEIERNSPKLHSDTKEKLFDRLTSAQSDRDWPGMARRS
jgi:HipA-like protein